MNVPNSNKWSVENPYTREHISEECLKRYEDKKRLLLQNKVNIMYPMQFLDEETSLKLDCLEVFQMIYHFGYPVDHEWFMKLNKKSDGYKRGLRYIDFGETQSPKIRFLKKKPKC